MLKNRTFILLSAVLLLSVCHGGDWELIGSPEPTFYTSGSQSYDENNYYYCDADGGSGDGAIGSDYLWVEVCTEVGASIYGELCGCSSGQLCTEGYDTANASASWEWTGAPGQAPKISADLYLYVQAYMESSCYSDGNGPPWGNASAHANNQADAWGYFHMTDIDDQDWWPGLYGVSSLDEGSSWYSEELDWYYSEPYHYKWYYVEGGADLDFGSGEDPFETSSGLSTFTASVSAGMEVISYGCYSLDCGEWAIIGSYGLVEADIGSSVDLSW